MSDSSKNTQAVYQKSKEYFEEIKNFREELFVKTEGGLISIKGQINNSKEKIRNFHKELFEDREGGEISIRGQINNSKEEIKNFREELLEDTEDGEISIKEQINNSKEEIKNFHKELFEDTEDGEISIRGQISNSKEEIKGFHKELFVKTEDGEISIRGQINNSKEKIRNFHKELFVKTEDGEISIKGQIDGFKEEIKGFHKWLFEDAEGGKILTKKRISDFEEDLKARIKGFETYKEKEMKEIKELKNRIEQLLPGAGSATLATAFRSAKAKYGHTSNSKKEKWHPLKNYWIPAIFNSLLIGSFVASAGLFIFFIQDIQDIGLEEIILRFLIVAPLGMVSLFSWTSIRFRQRMYEEYHYKQRVMELYQGFKKELDQEDFDEQKRSLIEVMLKTVADKPFILTKKNDVGIILRNVGEFLRWNRKKQPSQEDS